MNHYSNEYLSNIVVPIKGSITIEQNKRANDVLGGKRYGKLFQLFLLTWLAITTLLTSSLAQAELPVNQVLSLTGESGLTLPEIILSGDFTIETWINMTEGQAINNKDGIVKNSNTNQDINFYASRVRLFDRNNGWDIITANTVITAGKWTHVAFTRKDNIVRIYIDGVLDATSSGEYTADFVVDILGAAVAGSLHGQMEETRIWDVARSAEEISLSMQSEIAMSSPGLIAYYRYNTEVNSVISDLAGGDHNATMGVGGSISEGFDNEVIQSPAQIGQWSNVIPWPHGAILAASLPNGKIITWAGGGRVQTAYAIWNPTTNEHEINSAHQGHDMFCAHLVTLEDGRVLVNGGNDITLGIANTSIFDYRNNQWSDSDRMQRARWYPTSVAMPNGDVFTMAGNGGGSYPEMWTDGEGWQLKGGINIDEPILNYDQHYDRAWWPLLTLAPNGKIFHAGPTPEMHWVDTEGAGSMVKSNNSVTGYYPKHGSLVMYDEGKLISAGGALGGNQGSYGVPDLDGTLRSTNRTILIDLNGPAPTVREIDGMFAARKFHNGVISPNGEVMFFGGNTSGVKFNDDGSSFKVEIWNPETEKFREAAASSVPRNYHSTALLLTDGRVLNAGPSSSGQVYSPSYLFNEDGALATRPVINNVPDSIATGEQFTVNATAGLTKFSLIKLSATTHQVNTDLRYLNVEFSEISQGNYQLTAHSNTNVLTPGYWMLFGLNAQGTPSVSKVIHVDVEDIDVTPSEIIIIPSSTTPTVNGAASLFNASVSGGNGVISYEWNFGDGSPAITVVGNPAVSHTFTNLGLYVITVTATDSSGNQTIETVNQSIHGIPVDGELNHSSGLALDTDNHQLWNVNPDNNSVSILNIDNNSQLDEIAINAKPHSIALASENKVWVVHSEPAGITVIDALTLTISDTIDLPENSRPYGIVYDHANHRALVTLEAAGKLTVIDGTSRNISNTIDIGENVRHLSYSEGKSSIYVSRFISPPVKGESTPTPDVQNGGGEIVEVDSLALSRRNTIYLKHSNRQDSDHSARGIPNYLGAAVLSPDGKSAWVPSKQDNILRGTGRDGLELVHDQTVRAVTSNIDLALNTEDITKRIDHDNTSIASSAAFGKYGNYLFVSLEGSHEISVIDAFADNSELFRFDVGRAPQSLIISEDGMTLYVHNFMDRTIGVYDLSALIQRGVFEVNEIAVTSVVNTEQLSSKVLAGKQLFYDASDSRLSSESYMSCATCHNDGSHDGRVWDFTQFNEGFRNTITLEGHGEGQGRLHWSANFDEVHDFEGQIRNFAGGTGLMSDAEFNIGTRSEPLGDQKAGINTDLDNLANYVNSLSAFGKSPDRNNGALSAQALLGKQVFADNDCVSCHSGTKFTDSASNVLHDIGTGGNDQGLVNGVDTPTLLGLWNTAPYLHDGSAETLGQAINAHNDSNISDPELSQLVSYLRQIDDSVTGKESIAISNSDFMDPVFTDILYTRNIIPGWQTIGAQNGIWNPDGNPLSVTTANVAYIDNGGSISQAVNANFKLNITELMLSFKVAGGGVNADGSSSWEARLYAGDTIIGSVGNDDFDPDGIQLKEASLTLNKTQLQLFSHKDGAALKIEFYDSGNSHNVYFDDVKLVKSVD